MAAKKTRAKMGKRASGASPAAKRVTQRRSKAALPRAAAAPARKKKAASSAARRPTAAKVRPKSASAPAAAEATGIAVGDHAPSFELLDQEGSSVSSSSLAGQPYVLYFYPRDDTPGCTTEACGFRDALPEFERISVRVLGVSPDSVASHQKFVAKYGLSFPLLSDPEHELATAYGVWTTKKNYGREYMGILRSTFLVDREGVVRKVWRGVRVNGHVSEVQAAAAELA
jgi:thioredoxin-dependent peroxiredoxin